MTFEEARKVAAIVETAEGGCGGCVNEAVNALNKTFPLFTFKVVDIPPDPTWPQQKFMASIEVVYRHAEPPKAQQVRRC